MTIFCKYCICMTIYCKNFICMTIYCKNFICMTIYFKCCICMTIFCKYCICMTIYCKNFICMTIYFNLSRSQWPRGLWRKSAVAGLLNWGFKNYRGYGRFSVMSVLCVLRYRSLRRADHSSRGVLTTVMRRCVWSRNLLNEEALAHWGAVAPKKNRNYTVILRRLDQHYINFIWVLISP